MRLDGRRLWLSLRRAFIFTSAVYFLLQIVEIFVGEPTSPLLERLPLAWTWYWPKLFFSRSLRPIDRDLFFCLAANIVVYTIVIYGIAVLRDAWKRRTQRPETARKDRLTAVIVFLSVAVFCPQVAKSQDTALTPQRILKKMAERYASCSSYQDTGIVSVAFHMANETRVDKQPFKLFFIRPNRFRAEWSDAYLETPKFNILWSNATGTFYYREFNTFETKTSLADGVGVVSGISNNAAYTVPRLLLPEMDTIALTELKNPTLVGEEVFEDELCYRLKGYDSGDDLNEVWIGKRDFLVRKKTTHSALEDFSTVTAEIHRDIKINHSISDDIFDFKPPIPLKNASVKEGQILYAPPASGLWLGKVSFAKMSLLGLLGASVVTIATVAVLVFKRTN